MSGTVFTGWYCDETSPRNYEVHGAEINRGLAFRPLWWQSISRFVSPSHVVVVDSASPSPAPDDRYFSGRIDQIRLQVNPGHPQTTKFHYSGWTASVLVGLEYALVSDLDYFLYVEQDALLFGDGLLDKIESQLRRHKFVFGAGYGAWPLQQSVFAIRKDGYRQFLSRMHKIACRDVELSPELKFGIASAESPYLAALLDNFANVPVKTLRTKLVRRTLKALGEFAVLGFGYGRTRPINFNDDCFYFQQGTTAELNAYAARLGISLSALGMKASDET